MRNQNFLGRLLGRPVPNVPRRYYASDYYVKERATDRIVAVAPYESYSPSTGLEADDAASIIAKALDAQGIILPTWGPEE